jgi:hypothetical protein
MLLMASSLHRPPMVALSSTNVEATTTFFLCTLFDLELGCIRRGFGVVTETTGGTGSKRSTCATLALLPSIMNSMNDPGNSSPI